MPKQTCITILSDNQALPALTAEHGFAALVTEGNRRLLFDTGQDAEVLFNNAKQLGINLTNLDAIILSHGHYDHAGGLLKLLELNPECPVYLHPDALQQRYSIHPGAKAKQISISSALREKLQQLPSTQLRFNRSPVQLTESIWLSGEIPRVNQFEDTSGPFFLDTQGCRVDDLLDDQCLWIEQEETVSVLTGCCHAGVINTLNYVQQQTQEKSLNHIVGGLHLVNKNAEQLSATIKQLQQHKFQNLYPAHCTGKEQILALQEAFPEQVKSCYAGLTIN